MRVPTHRRMYTHATHVCLHTIVRYAYAHSTRGRLAVSDTSGCHSLTPTGTTYSHDDSARAQVGSYVFLVDTSSQ